jgi:hypothetical protein
MPASRELAHDPEKWAPVFRKDHAQIKKIEHFQRSPDAKPLSPAKRANRHSPREAVLFVGVDILLMTIKPGTAENR